MTDGPLEFTLARNTSPASDEVRAGILADPDQAMMAWQDYLIDHADWFLSPPGQDFLREFKNEGQA